MTDLDLAALRQKAEAARAYAERHGIKTWTDHIFAALDYADALLDRLESAAAEVLRQREINRRAERQTQALEGKLERVRSLHTKWDRGREVVCMHCNQATSPMPTHKPWPCPTIRALDREEGKGE